MEVQKATKYYTILLFSKFLEEQEVFSPTSTGTAILISAAGGRKKAPTVPDEVA